MRVHVDGTTHPIHASATGVSVLLGNEDGKTVEIQVSSLGDSLNIIVAGEHSLYKDQRGNLGIRVYPS